ncbi:class I adenylate-forming enzyme family protein [Allorhodopirellula solitaria]|uniref:Long-chain-fatty-acid--CoA ligase n=1 Tax=Allorhodopirellula solitaria TaxID=2527987 RepID=A0A5C5X0L7_9BACT|nr:AMP-binding protein [Allorhodopirellula solitaria]TWT55715.1 Long-chain-fatty-acid--CoA ligase [Allorhodopirellula solitaria]
MSRHLLDAFLNQVRDQPDAEALHCPGKQPRTWAQLAVDVNRTRGELERLASDTSRPAQDDRSSLGLRIVHESRNSISDVSIALACIAAGAIEIPIDSRLPAAMRDQIAKRCSGVRFQRDAEPVPSRSTDLPDALSQLERCSDKVDVHQPSLVLWTSGTTDEPRGVVLSQQNLTGNALAKLAAVPQGRDDIRLTLLSLAHAYARTCDMGTWLLSGCSWILDYGRSGLDRLSDANRPTMINCVPVLAREIAKRLEAGDRTLDQLAVLGCGGAALDRELFTRLRQCGVEVIQGYGCTETSPVICSASPGMSELGLVGPPINGCEVRIVDRRLFVRGPLVMLGYLDDAEATATKIDTQGWLDTGDLVERQDDGQMRILGRADDVIVLENAFKLHPLAVEQAILRHHACEHAVVFGWNGRVLIAVQSETFDGPAIATTLKTLLPPNTQVRIERLSPPLSIDRGELTAKKTPRRHIVQKRFTSCQ